jgi:hypothetical protein
MKITFLSLVILAAGWLLSGSANAQQPSCNPDFTYAQTGSNTLTYTFTNTTVASSTSYQSYALLMLTNNSYLTYMNSIGGNGSTAQYTFNAPGTYKVILSMSDSSVLGACNANDTQTIVVTGPPAPNANLYGNILAPYDSITTPTYVYPNLSFKVWLIQHDANTNMLTAVDSQIVSATNAIYVAYNFAGKPNGDYLVKAQDLLNINNGGLYMVPTYHMSSIYWYSAATINHTNTMPVYGQNIFMLSGAQTTGPGFIGGNVTQGANRPGAGQTLAVGDPVSNMDIYLKDEATDKVVAHTTTDAQGHYSFANLPAGTYTIFPDALNFETIADEHITVDASGSAIGNRNFTQTATKVKPTSPTALTNVTVALAGVYPNPVTDKLNISWKTQVNNATVKMYNILGEEVYSAAKPVTGIDMHHLAKGVYVLKITAGDAVQTLRISKQ